MAMSWNTLTAAKGSPGALATWVDYTKLDVQPTVDEAQTLLYGGIPGGIGLRTREMTADMAFTMPVGGAYQPLPTGFLDPIGRIYQTSLMTSIRHKDPNTVQRNRTYNETFGGPLTNPFTTAVGSATVAVNAVNHGFSQDSIFNTTGATAFNGVTIVGTFRVTSIIDQNNFNIDITPLGALPNASGAGGGTAVNFVCDSLIQGMPIEFGIWNETIYFDMAFSQITLCKLQFYQSLPLLSATNPTNFLTNRYPHLLRRACMASAADFMKDNEEFQKHASVLTQMIQAVNAENDMQWRGLELDTDTP
jgi:hypothetical protein